MVIRFHRDPLAISGKATERRFSSDAEMRSAMKGAALGEHGDHRSLVCVDVMSRRSLSMTTAATFRNRIGSSEREEEKTRWSRRPRTHDFVRQDRNFERTLRAGAMLTLQSVIRKITMRCVDGD